MPPIINLSSIVPDPPINKLLFTFKFSPIPTPPETTNAPLFILIEDAVDPITPVPPIYKLFSIPIPPAI